MHGPGAHLLALRYLGVYYETLTGLFAMYKTEVPLRDVAAQNEECTVCSMGAVLWRCCNAHL